MQYDCWLLLVASTVRPSVCPSIVLASTALRCVLLCKLKSWRLTMLRMTLEALPDRRRDHDCTLVRKPELYATLRAAFRSIRTSLTVPVPSLHRQQGAKRFATIAVCNINVSPFSNSTRFFSFLAIWRAKYAKHKHGTLCKASAHLHSRTAAKTGASSCPPFHIAMTFRAQFINVNGKEAEDPRRF